MVHPKEHLSNPVVIETLNDICTAVRQTLARPAQPLARRPRQRLQKLSEEQVAELVAAYLEGGTIIGLASQFGIGRTTVMAVLDREQVPRRHPGRVLTPDESTRARRLYQEGLSLRAVGSEIGADYRVVRRALIEQGVRCRRSG